MDAIDLLTHQHRALEELLRHVFDAPDAVHIGFAFARVADELTVHIVSEEQVFYPAVRAGRTEDILLESLEEHLSLKRLLADLLLLDPTEKTFEPKFKVLAEQAEHYHKEEEEHLFSKVRKLLDADRLQAIGQAMQTM